MVRTDTHWNKYVSPLIAVGHLLQEYQKLLDKVMNDKKEAKKKTNWRRLFYVATALIQLRNGLRAEEAVKATIYAVEKNLREFDLKAVKHGDLRTVVLPKAIRLDDLRDIVHKMLAFYHNKKSKHPKYNTTEKLIAQAYKQWVYEKEREILKNSHSLRYAFVEKARQEGIPADQIAAMLGHKTVNTTFKYIRTMESKEKLKDLFDF